MKTPVLTVLFLLAPLATAAAQRTAPSVKAAPLSAAEIVAVQAALQGAVKNAATRDAVRAAVLQQIRANQPIAFVRGHWVVPLDAAVLYNNATVRAAVVTQLGANPLAARVAQIAGANVGQRLGLAFVPNQFGAPMIGVSVNGLRGSMAEAAFLQNMTDVVPGNPIETIETGITGATVVFNHATGVLAGLANAFTNWWTGPGPKDPNTGLELDDPNADPDGDGVPNRLDGDDDADGTPDEEDSAPYDPGTQICHDCARGAAGAAAFTNVSASGVLQQALAGHAAAQQLARGKRLVSLGTASVGGQTVAVQIGFGTDLQ